MEGERSKEQCLPQSTSLGKMLKWGLWSNEDLAQKYQVERLEVVRQRRKQYQRGTSLPSQFCYQSILHFNIQLSQKLSSYPDPQTEKGQWIWRWPQLASSFCGHTSCWESFVSHRVIMKTACKIHQKQNR